MTAIRNIIAAAFITSVMTGLAGCNTSEFALAPVSGTVTVDGQPLKNGYIGFDPIAKEGSINAGRPSEAQTDEEGNFTLKTVDDVPGAVVATHKVWIKTKPRTSLGPDKIPAKFNMNTELKYEVPSGGTSDANFDITTK